jgi:hypothetical protein
MTVRRVDDTILLEAVCDVEDAEILLRHVQGGAALIDWSGCAHLHTACLQVILAAGVPVGGTPANAALAGWVGPLLHRAATPGGLAPSRGPDAPSPAEA